MEFLQKVGFSKEKKGPNRKAYKTKKGWTSLSYPSKKGGDYKFLQNEEKKKRRLWYQSGKL